MFGLGALRLVALIINRGTKKGDAADLVSCIIIGVVVGFYSSGVISTRKAIYPSHAVAQFTSIHRATHGQGATRHEGTDCGPAG